MYEDTSDLGIVQGPLPIKLHCRLQASCDVDSLYKKRCSTNAMSQILIEHPPCIVDALQNCSF